MSHDVSEPYTVYERRQRKARKPHACCACSEAIEIGHRYIDVFVLFDGSAATYKRCLRCEAIFDALVGALGDREEWPDEDLNCGHEWTENLGIPLPPEVERLAFLTAAEMQAGTAAEGVAQ